MADRKPGALSYVKAWGESPFPPTLLATFIAAQHARPPQFLPLLFPPVLLFSSYINVHGYKIDGAGISAAWSGLYLVLARRRWQPLMRKWGARGIIRGTTVGLCATNVVGGALVYAIGKRSKEDSAREGNDIA
ncbi:hypothetical protein MMC29_004152 [Sticta canariensis]|nr:hypothetical protein [Sticta canariensis]